MEYAWKVRKRRGGIEVPIRDWEVAKVYWREGWVLRRQQKSPPPRKR